MREEKISADRLAACSDAVFAVIVTIMVLELKAPDEASFSALWPLWPTAISYAVRTRQKAITAKQRNTEPASGTGGPLETRGQMRREQPIERRIIDPRVHPPRRVCIALHRAGRWRGRKGSRPQRSLNFANPRTARTFYSLPRNKQYKT
jgi:Endosomal/lysosomal potassium channel TMEM175